MNFLSRFLKISSVLTGLFLGSLFCLRINPVWAEPLNACPAEINLCATPGPEDNSFYPYPGSSCYRLTKEPKVIINQGVEAQKQVWVPYEDYAYTSSVNWEFTVGAESDNLKIPLLWQMGDHFEGDAPFGRYSPDPEFFLEDFGPASKLTLYSPLQDKLKQIIAVSAIDSQCTPPASCSSVGELSLNPIHDYIVAYAIPAQGKNPSLSGGCNDKDWWYGGEEYKDDPKARPIRASEPDCTAFLKSGTVPIHAEAGNLQSKYAGLVCPKLYGNPLGAGNGLYVQKLRNEGKIFCPLSEQVLVEVWLKFMPIVSHETEPTEVILTFDGKPSGKGKIYLPHLARLEQLSFLLQQINDPNIPTPNLSNLTVNNPKVGGNSFFAQDFICPAYADLMPTPAQGGGDFDVDVPPRPISTPPLSHYPTTLRQSGTLQIAIPELLRIKENLIGDKGFFRTWLPKEIGQKIDQEVAQNGDALEGEGVIRIIPKSNVDSVSPSQISIKYPFLNTIEKYYLAFIESILPDLK